jgi:hypothetical protein
VFSSTALTSAASTVTLPTGYTATDVGLTLVYTNVPMNYRDDGTAPTANIVGTGGMPVAGTSYLAYEGLANKLQLIAQSTSGTASILFYG